MKKIYILIVILAVLLPGYFLWSQKKLEVPISVGNTPTTTTLETLRDTTTYTNVEYKFKVSFSSTLTFYDRYAPEFWQVALVSPEESKRQPTADDCGGSVPKPENLGVNWFVYDVGENVPPYILNRDKSKYQTVSIGNKILEFQKIGGMCGDSNSFIWNDPTGKHIVVFDVLPASTAHVDEYEQLISSFEFL